MAEILSQSEQTNLDALLNIGQYTHYWIGLSDMAHEGKFEWQHSFTPLGEYTNWSAWDPQKDNGDCVLIVANYNWVWGTWHCDHNINGNQGEIHALCQY